MYLLRSNREPMSSDRITARPATSERALRPAYRARILVVDDQPSNLQVVGSMLGGLGYDILPASDGPTALKRLSFRLPDLILLDVLMPGMDGVEVCRQIRRNSAWVDIPVIFLSAADDKDLIVRALEAGGMDYVTKPFNHAELLSRVRTHLDLKAARDRLQQLAEDKDELLGILAHDLKNHLGGVQMSASLLRDRMARHGDSRSAQLSENIWHSTNQLLGFVKEFLANSAADHSIALQPERVNLGDAAARAVQDYREAAQRKNLDFRLQLPEEPVTVLADQHAVSQVLDNLVSNAVKFSPPDKSILVAVRSDANGALCSVQDQGPGLNEEDKSRMFRRYGRLSTRPTGGEPSTGLGLSIVKKLVKAMDGKLSCDSQVGQGTTFTVWLPALS
jgi:two-component system, sensor histidine kinase and response regulator